MTATPALEAPPDQIAGYLGLSVTRRHDGSVEVVLPASDRLWRSDGTVHPVALLVAIDMAAGMSAGFATLPRWTLTSDMSVHLHAYRSGRPLIAVGRPVHVGGRSALAEVMVTDDRGMPVATASVNHALVAMETPLQFVDLAPGESATPTAPQWADLRADALFDEAAQIESFTGSVTLGFSETTRNPWGIFHGAVLGHLALSAAAQAGVSTPKHLTIRYLRPVTADGAAATAITSTMIGTDVGLATVELRQLGVDSLACQAYVSGTR